MHAEGRAAPAGDGAVTRETALRRVRLAARDLGAYAEATEHDVLDEVRELAADLRGLRLVQVNSTASGGGVAELLQSLLPLELGLGLDVEWRLPLPRRWALLGHQAPAQRPPGPSRADGR